MALRGNVHERAEDRCSTAYIAYKTNKQTNKRTNTRANKQRNKKTNKRTNEQANKQTTNEQTRMSNTYSIHVFRQISGQSNAHSLFVLHSLFLDIGLAMCEVDANANDINKHYG